MRAFHFAGLMRGQIAWFLYYFWLSNSLLHLEPASAFTKSDINDHNGLVSCDSDAHYIFCCQSIAKWDLSESCYVSSSQEDLIHQSDEILIVLANSESNAFEQARELLHHLPQEPLASPKTKSATTALVLVANGYTVDRTRMSATFRQWRTTRLFFHEVDYLVLLQIHRNDLGHSFALNYILGEIFGLPQSFLLANNPIVIVTASSHPSLGLRPVKSNEMDNRRYGNLLTLYQEILESHRGTCAAGQYLEKCDSSCKIFMSSPYSLQITQSWQKNDTAKPVEDTRYRVPTLAFPLKAYHQQGPFDERLLWQGVFAEWLSRDSGCTLHEVNERQSLEDLYGNLVANRKESISAKEAAILEEYAQRDIDNAFLIIQEASDEWSDALQHDANAALIMSSISSWSGRTPSSHIVARRTQSAVQKESQKRVAALIPVHDYVRLLPSVVESVAGIVSHVMILVNTVSFSGARLKSPSNVLRACTTAVESLANSSTSYSIIRNDAPLPENETRNFGLEMLRTMPQKFSHVLVLDSDEYYDPVQLSKALSESLIPSTGGLEEADICVFHAKWNTYFGALRLRIVDGYGDNSYRPPILVNIEKAKFSLIREAHCPEPNYHMHIHPDYLLMHHLSYIRTDRELGPKLSFSHASDVQSRWKQEVWDLRKTQPKALRDFHPMQITAKAYHKLVTTAFHELPPILRQMYLKEIRNCNTIAVRDWTDEQWMWCYDLSIEEEDTTSLVGQATTMKETERGEEKVYPHILDSVRLPVGDLTVLSEIDLISGPPF